MLCFAILFHVNSEADGQYRRNKKFHKVGHDIRHHAKHKRAFHADTADVFPVNRDKPCRTENVTYRKPRNICGEKAAEIRRLMFKVTVLSVPDYVGCAVAFGRPFFVPARGPFACGASESYRRVASAPNERVSGNPFNT